MNVAPIVSTISGCFSIGAISYAVYRYRWIRRDSSFDMVIVVINAGTRLAKMRDMENIRAIFNEIDESVDIARQLVLDAEQELKLESIKSTNEQIRDLYGDSTWDEKFPPLRAKLDADVSSLRQRTFKIRRNA